MISRIVGFLLIAGCLCVVYFCENASGVESSFRVFHWPAMVLTGIGPIGLMLLSSDWNKISSTVKLLFNRSHKNAAQVHAAEAEYLHGLSQRYYAQGPRAFDTRSTDEFTQPLQRVIRRLSTRIPVMDVRNLLEREASKTEEELQQSIGILSLGVRLAPSVGMLGTILGMVKLLSNLKDPSNIGSHMGLALLTTFYGLLFSLVFWTPLEQTLQNYLASELRGIDQTLHWLELLEQRKPAQYFSEHHNPPVEAGETEAV